MIVSALCLSKNRINLIECDRRVHQNIESCFIKSITIYRTSEKFKAKNICVCLTNY